MKKIFPLLFLLLIAVACTQNENNPDLLPTAAVVATLPPLPEGSNGVVIMGEGMSMEAVAEEALVAESVVVEEDVDGVESALPTIDATGEAYGFTYQQADGNRVVAGAGLFPDVEPRDIQLQGVPKWITAVTDGMDVVWTVVMEDGTVQAFRVNTEAVVEVTNLLSIANLGDVPPLLYLTDGNPDFAVAPAANTGPTHPAILSDGTLAYSLLDGGVVVGDVTLDVTAMPDARILTDENDRLLLLSDPTNRYPHAVLGDDLEGGSITLIETQPETAVVNQIIIPDPKVIEGMTPLWVDWNGDGEREIIVTQSDASQGAQIVLYSEAGETLAVGPAIGRGQRWRQPLAVAPFGPNGEMELVDVLTPHIGGVVEFYQWNGDVLEIVATLPGFTAHVIYKDNMDTAVAGDFNGDGRMEILLPTQDRTQLGGIQRTDGGAEVVYQLPIDGVLTTNLAGATLITGETAVAVGREDGVLRIWQ